MAADAQPVDPVALLRRLGEDVSPFEDAPAGPRALYRRMADVEYRPVEHLWRGYLVRRKLNLLAGYGGVGKGQLMADLIARGSTGRPMPGSHDPAAFRSLILASEDDPHEDLRPRLDANGADLANVLILDGVATGGDGVRWVDLRQHLPVVEDLVREERVDLLYIDPLSSYMPGVARRDAGDVRDTLGYVQRLIDRTGVTVVATLHLGKAAQDRKGAMRLLDSVEFVNAARNVLAVNDLPDEYQPDEVLEDATCGRHKLLACVKANSTIPGPPLVFSRPLDQAVQWHGVSPIGFDESFATSQLKGSKGQDAEAWAFDFLKGGAQPSSNLFADAKASGIAEKTLREALKRLGATSFQLPGRAHGGWLWRLPDGLPTPMESDRETK